ncbi:MAG: hydroxymethylglutaryl-CoA reductase, partial [Bacteroidota bacterium]
MLVPSLLLKQLYTFGSLKNTDQGVQFSLKNRLSDATVTKFTSLSIGGHDVPLDKVTILLEDGKTFEPTQISASHVIDFPLRAIMNVQAEMPHLEIGKHKLEVGFEAKPFGKLKLKVEGAIQKEEERKIVIPRSNKDDYDEEIIKIRQPLDGD